LIERKFYDWEVLGELGEYHPTSTETNQEYREALLMRTSLPPEIIVGLKSEMDAPSNTEDVNTQARQYAKNPSLNKRCYGCAPLYHRGSSADCLGCAFKRSMKRGMK
jgi:hypothetical protein